MTEYRSLKSLYHQDEGLCRNTYEKRYNGEGTYRFDFSVGEHPAFVVLSKDLVQKSDSIRKLQVELERLERDIPGLSVILMDSLFQEIEQSNEIEGIHSSRKDLEQALHPKKGTRFAGQLKQYSRLLKGDIRFPETSLEVRKIYDEMLLEDIAKDNPDNVPDGVIFRAEPVYVSDGLKKIHSGIMPEEMVISMMDKVLSIVRDDSIPALVRIAVFHFLFGYIHPFYDGNGRLNRFLTSILVAQELSQLASLNLSLTFRIMRTQYYRGFVETEHPLNRGDLTPFVLMFLNVLTEAISREIERLQAQKTKFASGLEALDAEDMPESEKKFLRILLSVSLFTVQGIPKKELETLLEKSATWVSKRLAKYEDRLYSVCIGRAKYYTLRKSYLEDLVNRQVLPDGSC